MILEFYVCYLVGELEMFDIIMKPVPTTLDV